MSRIPWVRTDVARGRHDGARRRTRETDTGVWELVEGRSERGMRSWPIERNRGGGKAVRGGRSTGGGVGGGGGVEWVHDGRVAVVAVKREEWEEEVGWCERGQVDTRLAAVKECVVVRGEGSVKGMVWERLRRR